MMDSKVDWDHIFKIDGWISKSEARFLYKTAARLEGRGVIVEIGSWKGKSTVCLAKGLKPTLNVKIFSIDPHIGSEEHQPPDCQKIWTFDTFQDNLLKFNVADKVVPIIDYSNKVAETWSRPIELLFIDGAHDEPSVEKDFSLFFPHIVNGGWVVMHDTTGTLIPGLSGWRGPRKVANKYMFKSRLIRQVKIVDTITAGRRTSNFGLRDSCQILLARLRKLPMDMLSIILNNKSRVPLPAIYVIRLARRCTKRL